MTEWTIQIARQNFQWAATAASGLGIVRGTASELPETYDPYNGLGANNEWLTEPGVSYDASKFDAKGRVFFNLTRAVPNERCAYCHSSAWNGEEAWNTDQDVHLQAGLSCTDCHRNALDHQITRGYEGEAAMRGGAPASLSCRGCHLGDEADTSSNGMGGRLGAPKPKHLGLPAFHLDRLSCTACHSGPWPGAKTGVMRTSRANRLGIHGKAQWDTELPRIASPVFAKQENGIIEACNMVWPAFWGVMRGDKMTPLLPEQVKPVLEGVIQASLLAVAESVQTAAVDAPAAAETPETEAQAAPASEPAAPAPAPAPSLDEAMIAHMLTALSQPGTLDGTPVYVAGGMLYQLRDGQLDASSHPAAQPYSWPLSHDVRPASQALGSGGCTDCHGADSGFFMGTVKPMPPGVIQATSDTPMYALQGSTEPLVNAWNQQMALRPYYLAADALVCIFLALGLAIYGYRGIERFARARTVQAGARFSGSGSRNE